MARRSDRSKQTGASQADKAGSRAQLRSRAETELTKLAPTNADATADQVQLHELRVHQVELEMQNEELRRVQSLLESSRDRFAWLYDQSPVGYLTIDAEGVIREANMTAVRLFGCEQRPAVLNHKVARFVAAVSQDNLYLHCQLVFTTGSRQICECQLQRADGNLHVARITTIVEPVETGQEPRLLMSLNNVTRQFEAEEALRRSEAQLSGIFRSAMDGIITVDEKQRIVMCNEAAGRIFGRKLAELIGQPLDLLIPVGDRLAHRQLVRAFGTSGVTNRQMGTVGYVAGVRADGTEFPIEASISQIESTGGKLFTVILRDITRRLRAEEGQARLAAIVDFSSDAILSLDLEGNIMSWNAGAEKLFGYSAIELIGRKYTTLVPAELIEEAQMNMGKAAQGEMVAAFDTERVARDGRRITVSVTISPIRNADGKILGTSAIIRDITGRKRMEIGLRSAHERLERLLTSSSAVVYTAEACGNFRATFVSPNIRTLLGYDPEDFVDNPDFWTEHLHPDDRPRVLAELSHLLDQDRYSTEYRFVGKDGCIRWMLDEMSVLRDPAGQPYEIVGFWLDITKRKEADEALQQSEVALNDFFSAAPLGLLWVKPDGRILRANQSLLDLVGRAAEELIDQPINELHADPENATASLDRLAKAETLRNRHVLFRNRDGTVRHMLIDANGLWDRGRLLHTRWFVRDITQRVTLENEIVNISEREQQRIGRELHDGLGQHLYAIYYMSKLLHKDLTATGSDYAARVERLGLLLEESLEMTRSLARGLYPVSPVPEGLILALRELAQRTRKLYHIDCSFRCQPKVAVANPNLATHLYRIAHEAVNNAIKHGQPTRVQLQLVATPEKLILGIKDNGKGIQLPTKGTRGMGLHVMEHRANACSSTLVVQKLRAGGTEVICTVPRLIAEQSGLGPPTLAKIAP